MTLQSLNCPNCSAPLPDPAGRLMVMCTHCQTIVRVALTYETPSAAAPPDDKPYTPSDRVPAHITAKLVEFLRAGRRLEAIEHYQAAANATEQQARDVVDAIQAGLPPRVVPLGQVDLDRIRQLLRDRRRTYAIQLYREQAGVSMSDAGKAIAAIEAGREPPPIVLAAVPPEPADPPETGEPLEAAMARAVHNVPSNVNLPVIQGLLRTGKKVEAIQQYRMAAGVGLKEAKDAVEAIAASTPGVSAALAKSGRGDSKGCFSLLGLMVILALCITGGCGTVAQTTGTYRCAVGVVKADPATRAVLGEAPNAGYLVLSPGYQQSFDFDGSWHLSMDLFMPAWGSRGLGLLYMEAVANDTGYTSMRATLFKDFKRHVVRSWGQVECR